MPNPLKEENMVDLQAKVRETGADIGIGLDGDGDRLGVVDNEGNILWPDMYMILLERAKCWRAGPRHHLRREVLARADRGHREARRQALMWRTGYTNVFAKRLETGAPFAGEFSGHMFFDDPRLDFDDGIYAGRAPARGPRRRRAAHLRALQGRADYYNTPEGRMDVDESEEVRGDQGPGGAVSSKTTRS